MLEGCRKSLLREESLRKAKQDSADRKAVRESCTCWKTAAENLKLKSAIDFSLPRMNICSTNRGWLAPPLPSM